MKGLVDDGWTTDIDIDGNGTHSHTQCGHIQDRERQARDRQREKERDVKTENILRYSKRVLSLKKKRYII